MIIKVSVSKLRPGMFVHDFNCDWLHHPFFSNQLLLKDRGMIEKIINQNIREVYIDTGKGLAPAQESPRTATAVAEPPEEEKAPEPEMPEVDPFEERLSHIRERAIGDEIPDAAKARKKAETVLDNIFAEVQAGREINVRATRAAGEEMVESALRNKHALPAVVKLTKANQYLRSRAVNVASLMVSFGAHLGMPPAEMVDLAVGSLLHDIGMLRIDPAILAKPGKLTDEEYQQIKLHVAIAAEMLNGTGEVAPESREIVTMHHERNNGSGYPEGLKGSAIPPAAGMAGIADAYDAMTTARSYRGEMKLSAANRKLFEIAALEQFDDKLVQSFIQCTGLYPVGSVVGLSSGKLGIVIRQNPENLLKPVVRVIYDNKRGSFIRPRDVDILHNTDGEEVVPTPPDVKWKINILDYIS
ncbi:MAG: HD-GYP domain-containing protein [Nitrospinae bacterium]|nr:HD-GYP domain-containing protein [Nitrospinota bacterium]